MTTASVPQIVTFRLGDDLFAADIFAVERVLRYRPPTPLPNVPAWIDGVIEYGDRVVPVLDMRSRFGMPVVEPGPLTRTLVLNVGGEWIAAVVDAVLEVTTLVAGQIAPPPPLFRGLSAEYLRGIVRHGDRLLIFLDVERLLSSNERLSIEQAVDERLIIERSTEEVLPEDPREDA
ncbi:MAG: chemotaxis protein CheW [Gemmatimonadaceae bacterium]